MKSKCCRRHSKVSGKWMTLVNLSMGIWQPAQSLQLPYRYRSASLLLPKVNNRSLGPVSKNTHKHTKLPTPLLFIDCPFCGPILSFFDKVLSPHAGRSGEVRRTTARPMLNFSPNYELPRNTHTCTFNKRRTAQWSIYLEGGKKKNGFSQTPSLPSQNRGAFKYGNSSTQWADL